MDSEADRGAEYSPGDGEHLGVCIVRAVAEVGDVDPDDLAVALNDVVDPDAVDRLFAPRADGTARQGGELSFTFAACRVTVEPDRTVVVRPEPRA
jgi:hypothetical protein